MAKLRKNVCNLGRPSTTIHAVKRDINLNKLTDNELFLTIMDSIKVGAIHKLQKVKGQKRVWANRAVFYLGKNNKMIVENILTTLNSEYRLIIVAPRKGWDVRFPTTTKFNYYLDCMLWALPKFYDIGGDLNVSEGVEYSYKKCRRPRSI
ncbi:MAG: hypothetical protein V3U54_07670 [Thermodesulfobacteriota bacterium]